MSWISNITPPGIKKMFTRREDSPETLWVKCPSCADMVFHRDMEAAQHVCPSCGHHLRIRPAERLMHLFDGGAFDEIELPDVVDDPLKFKDEKRYADRLKDYRKKTNARDAMRAAVGRIEGVETVAVVQDFAFMGGSMGLAVGEAMVAAATKAVEKKAPLVVFTGSGGARMQEGILSLMQMPRTTIAAQMVKDAGLPYIVVLTDPTTGGVTASYAMLGDLQFAEPGALIGFAGPRVIEQTIREKLPEGFQRSEYLYDKGMLDQVVHRHEMRRVLGRVLSVLMGRPTAEIKAMPAPAASSSDGAAFDKAAE